MTTLDTKAGRTNQQLLRSILKSFVLSAGIAQNPDNRKYLPDKNKSQKN